MQGQILKREPGIRRSLPRILSRFFRGACARFGLWPWRYSYPFRAGVSLLSHHRRRCDRSRCCGWLRTRCNRQACPGVLHSAANDFRISPVPNRRCRHLQQLVASCAESLAVLASTAIGREARVARAGDGSSQTGIAGRSAGHRRSVCGKGPRRFCGVIFIIPCWRRSLKMKWRRSWRR